MNKNPIPLSNLNIRFSIKSITANTEANQILVSKSSGEISRQFALTEINSKETEEIKRDIENSNSKIF